FDPPRPRAGHRLTHSLGRPASGRSPTPSRPFTLNGRPIAGPGEPMSPNFRAALSGLSNDLSRFDTAAGSDDLANFDAADGTTSIPAGWYTATVTCGELVTTKAGKCAYRLALDVSEGPHRWFRLWRYFTFDTPLNANRAKALLAPLGLRTSADLRRPFPDP